LGVGLEEAPLRRGESGDDARGAPAKTMDAVLAVHIEDGRPEQLGELAGTLATEQVHLEEAFLGMDEAERARGIGPGGGADRGHAQGVALDLDRRREAGDRAPAIELRQARRELDPEPQRDAAED